MQNHPLKFLLIVAIASLLTIFHLQQSSAKRHLINNGFNRKYTASLHNKKPFDLHLENYYIAGISSRSIYLVTSIYPTTIFKINTNLNDAHFVVPKLPNTGKIAERYIRVKIDSPTIYMLENITPTILIGNFSDIKMDVYPIFHAGFITWLPLTNKSLAITSFDNEIKENILVKLSKTNYGEKEQRYILSKQFPGTFSTHGIINFDKPSNRIIFVYHYRNEFVCLDSNLTKIYAAHTIDTNSRVKITVADNTSEHYTTFSSPAEEINKKSCISGPYLFIHSGLRSDNESIQYFNNNSDIDVYATGNGRYLFSLVIPDYYGFKLTSFAISGNRLAGVFGHYLVSYEINFPFFAR